MTPAGAMIMSLFAAVWSLAGLVASGRGTAATYAIPPVIAGAIILAALRAPAPALPMTPGERSRQGRLVGIASAVEGVLILLAVNVLANAGRRDLTACVVAIIVGLHFFPLALRLPARLYHTTGLLLVLLGAAGFGIPDIPRRTLTVCIGAAVVLWGTSLMVLSRQRGRRPAGAGPAAPPSVGNPER